MYVLFIPQQQTTFQNDKLQRIIKKNSVYVTLSRTQIWKKKCPMYKKHNNNMHNPHNSCLHIHEGTKKSLKILRNQEKCFNLFIFFFYSQVERETGGEKLSNAFSVSEAVFSNRVKITIGLNVFTNLFGCYSQSMSVIYQNVFSASFSFFFLEFFYKRKSKIFHQSLIDLFFIK